MGCPAKKVCAVAAGSALLRDEPLVQKILDAVVSAVDIPVTLKIRTGWDLENRNAVTIAKIAENAGVSALTVHGRTRACKFAGVAEYDTIKAVKQAVNIPIIANGDIDSVEKAVQVLQHTGADAIMIGRAAQGNPWLFAEIDHFMRYGKALPKPSLADIHHVLAGHLEKLYHFYGAVMGVRIARKHIGWYFQHLDTISQHTKNTINQAQTPTQQFQLVAMVFNHLPSEIAA
jgi:tRNA-dihydrouridine synthase B